MPKFIYHDNSKGKHIRVEEVRLYVAPVVFECEAESIFEADSAFEAALGSNPRRFDIGLSIEA